MVLSQKTNVGIQVSLASCALIMLWVRDESLLQFAKDPSLDATSNQNSM